jgi:hypothetical protein
LDLFRVQDLDIRILAAQGVRILKNKLGRDGTNHAYITDFTLLFAQKWKNESSLIFYSFYDITLFYARNTNIRLPQNNFLF